MNIKYITVSVLIIVLLMGAMILINNKNESVSASVGDWDITHETCVGSVNHEGADGVSVFDWNGDGDPELVTAQENFPTQNTPSRGRIEIIENINSSVHNCYLVYTPPSTSGYIPSMGNIDSPEHAEFVPWDIDGNGTVDDVAVLVFSEGDKSEGGRTVQACFPATPMDYTTPFTCSIAVQQSSVISHGARALDITKDMDGDGITDVIWGMRNFVGVTFPNGNDLRNVSTWTTIKLFTDRHILGVYPVDLDGDSLLDIVAVPKDGSGGRVKAIRNLGSRNFANTSELTITIAQGRFAHVGDLNGDNCPDVLAPQNSGVLYMTNPCMGVWTDANVDGVLDNWVSNHTTLGYTPQDVHRVDLDTFLATVSGNGQIFEITYHINGNTFVVDVNEMIYFEQNCKVDNIVGFNNIYYTTLGENCSNGNVKGVYRIKPVVQGTPTPTPTATATPTATPIPTPTPIPHPWIGEAICDVAGTPVVNGVNGTCLVTDSEHVGFVRAN